MVHILWHVNDLKSQQMTVRREQVREYQRNNRVIFQFVVGQQTEVHFSPGGTFLISKNQRLYGIRSELRNLVVNPGNLAR